VRNDLASGLIRGDDAVLIVIDMQERLFPVMTDKAKLLQNVVRLLRFSEIVELPVVFTEQEKIGDTLPQIRNLVRSFHPVRKIHFDCFSSEAFKKRVQKLDRSTLILAGIEAHICVAQTALHGADHYRVHVVGDALSSRSPQNREIAIQRMTQYGVTVTSTEMVIYELLGKAGTDTFRQALELVK
jgi:nicotinamidase-related amidase